MGKRGSLTVAGTYCPNAACKYYQQVGSGSIIRYGKTRQGYQRYQCKNCGRVFNQQVGTLFYGKRSDPQDIIESLAMLAEGMGLRATARVKRIKPDTLSAWLRQAARHAQQIEQVLLQEYDLSASQIDALWTFVRRKGEKK